MAWRLPHENPGPATELRRSPIDGEVRMHRVVRLRDLPLAVSVGLAERDYLGVWRARAVETAAVASVIAAIIALIGTAPVRRLSGTEAADDALRVSDSRLDQAPPGVRGAVWG